jgi:hypothetical protein
MCHGRHPTGLDQTLTRHRAAPPLGVMSPRRQLGGSVAVRSVELSPTVKPAAAVRSRGSIRDGDAL